MSKRRGVPAWNPSSEQRQLVQVLAACGNSHDTIARALGVKSMTLSRACSAELKYGHAHVKAMVGASVVKSALAGNSASQRHWLSCFGGPEWRMHWNWRDPDAPAPDGVASGGTTIIIEGGLAPLIYGGDQGTLTIDAEPSPEGVKPNGKGNGADHSD